MEFVPSEKGVPIRMPSTANLQVDSLDRGGGFETCFNFGINRNFSIFNGFFTRIGTTEVTLEWNLPNIITNVNDKLIFDISGGSTYTVTIPEDSYTVEELLTLTVADLNTQSSPTLQWSVAVTVDNGVVIDLSGGQFDLSGNTVLQNQLGIQAIGVFTTYKRIIQPDIRNWRYLDFVSAQLTYNQDLKDASTCPIVRDVLCRWYFVWDNPPTIDGFGFPILMGYTTFCARRLFNPPKQIRWDPRQPLGNLAFEVYGQSRYIPGAQTGLLLSDFYNPQLADGTNWLMTLQISEV